MVAGIILMLGFEMVVNTPTLAAPLGIGHDEFPLMDRNYPYIPIRALASLVGY